MNVPTHVNSIYRTVGEENPAAGNKACVTEICSIYSLTQNMKFKTLTKIAICNYCITGNADMHTHPRMHTSAQMLQTVNSLGHYSFKHKSLGSVIPSFKKISMFM
jgi:hypothetical protein